MAKIGTYVPSGAITSLGGSSGTTELDVALGNVSGLTYEFVSGRNPDIDTGTLPEDVWLGSNQYGGLETTAAQTLDVVSTSALDDDGNTGANTIRIYGLDSSYNEITEEVTMDGLTPVTTTATFLRVNRAIVLTAGSTGTNQGQIDITLSAAPSTVMGIIGSLVGSTQQCTWTVPAGKRYYLRRIFATLNDAVGTHSDFNIQIRPQGMAWRASVPIGIGQAGGPIEVEFPYFPVLEAQTDFRARVDLTNSANTDITVTLQFLVEDI